MGCGAVRGLVEEQQGATGTDQSRGPGGGAHVWAQGSPKPSCSGPAWPLSRSGCFASLSVSGTGG